LASLVNVNSVVGNQSTNSFVVRYTDDTAINIRSVNFGDIRVTGPNGSGQMAAFSGVNVNSNGSPRDATYFIAAPGGSWDYSDNGTYTIQLLSQEVADPARNFAYAVTLGSFSVNLLPPEIRPRAHLTELNATDWYAWADSATA